MLADETDFVIGVDTHRDRHSAAIVNATGGVLEELDLAASSGGYRNVLARARRRADGRRVWAIEGTGSYGAGLARFLIAQGERVVEIDRPRRREGRAGAKSDALDAIRAAREALGREQLPTPRLAGQRDGLRALLMTREGAVLARTAAINQLRALIVVAPEPLRGELRGLAFAELIERCAHLRPGARGRSDRPLVTAVRSCAQRIRALQHETRELRRQILELVRELAPALMHEPGVGPISAAHLIIAWSHPQRFRSEAAFAMLAGTSPVPASSGQTVRHRLNRGGDRRLNRALHTIVLARRATHEPTQAYLDRRVAEAKANAKLCAASSATSPAASTASSRRQPPRSPTPPGEMNLDNHRSIKAERFIRTMLGGWAYGAIYGTSAERTRALPGWLDHYNRRRPHRSLNRQTPLTRLQQMRNNAPGSYT